jgi:t-SNARE complex subunit (syntaxin)
MEIDSKVQTVKRLLQLKKVNPDQMSVLSQSVCKSEQEEEIESLIAEKSFNEQGHLKIDPETTIVREKRIRRIENKFEYVNMICADLNGMVETQGECIRNLEGNFAKGVENTAKASKELQKLNQYHDSSSKKVCVLILLLILAAAGTVFFVRTHPHANFRLAIPKLQ